MFCSFYICSYVEDVICTDLTPQTGESTAGRREAPARGACALCGIVVMLGRGRRIFHGFCRKRRRFREPVRRKRPSWENISPHLEPPQGSTH